MLDFHNHLMPAVDDGAANIEESRSGLEVLRDQGVRTIVTTPHVRGSETVRRDQLEAHLARLDRAYESLRELAEAEFPELRVERGVELMLDIPAPALSDPRLRLAGSNCVLIEFPHMSIPPHSTLAIREISAGGLIPIIAHPERYSNMGTNIDLIESWRDVGAGIQINSGSVVGQYGSIAKKLVWLILEHGHADYLSSDYHSRGRCAVRRCAAEMLEQGGSAQLRRLTVTNPERMLRSEAPLPVEPLEEMQLGFWQKMFRK